MTARLEREAGQTSVVLIGFFVVIALLVVVVVDASAAYLRRQRLDALADGAALAAVDGIRSDQLYVEGLGEQAVLDATARPELRRGLPGPHRRRPVRRAPLDAPDDRRLRRGRGQRSARAADSPTRMVRRHGDRPRCGVRRRQRLTCEGLVRCV